MSFNCSHNSCKWSFKTFPFLPLSGRIVLSNSLSRGNSGALSDSPVNYIAALPTDPPTITESKSNEATTGRQASLKCEASAVPAPDFEWYRDDTRYVPNLPSFTAALGGPRGTRSPNDKIKACCNDAGLYYETLPFPNLFNKCFGACRS